MLTNVAFRFVFSISLYSPQTFCSSATHHVFAAAVVYTFHSVPPMIENLDRLKVTMPKDVKAIVQLSDYGRKETVIWKLFLNTNWGKITAPGKYIIKSLCSPKA